MKLHILFLSLLTMASTNGADLGRKLGLANLKYCKNSTCKSSLLCIFCAASSYGASLYFQIPGTEGCAYCCAALSGCTHRATRDELI